MQNQRTKWKTQFDIIESASLFHNKVRNILATDTFFKELSCFQEVPISGLVPSYQNNQHCVDWYIDELGTILELHGRQHYVVSNFGNIAYEKAQANFYSIRYRDNLKKEALLQAGYEYREISYKVEKNLNAAFLKEIIFSYD